MLSAVKVLMKFMEALPADSDYLDQVTKKLAPPLGKQAKRQLPFCYSQLWSCVLVCFFFFCALFKKFEVFVLFSLSVTLLSGEPEIQFVALRNINLIVQKR